MSWDSPDGHCHAKLPAPTYIAPTSLHHTGDRDTFDLLPDIEERNPLSKCLSTFDALLWAAPLSANSWRSQKSCGTLGLTLTRSCEIIMVQFPANDGKLIRDIASAQVVPYLSTLLYIQHCKQILLVAALWSLVQSDALVFQTPSSLWFLMSKF